MNPFSKLTVDPDYGNDKCVISWDLKSEGFEGSEFFVRKSPDGERNIEIVQQSLAETAREFVDDKFIVRGRTERVFYQVILRHDGIAYHSNFVEASGRKTHTTPETSDDESQPESEEAAQQDDEVLEIQERKTPAPTPVSTDDDTYCCEEETEETEVQELQPLDREFGIIQQITKLERLNMQHTGNPCAVLKPKKIGELSHEGLDQDTNQDVNVFGIGRYGQKYVGGFEDPIYTHMLGLQQRTDITIAVQTGEGEVDKYAYAIRMLGAPRIAHDDIIVDLYTNIRYAVKKVDRHQLKGVHDVVQMIMATAVERNNPVYKYPVANEKETISR